MKTTHVSFCCLLAFSVFSSTCFSAIKNKDKDEEKVTSDDQTILDEALIEAAGKGNYKTVVELLAKEADPNYQNDFGITALHKAVSGDYLEIVKLLLTKGAKPIFVTELGATALHYAFDPTKKHPYKKLQKTIDILKLLIAHGGDINASDQKKQKPLDYARIFKMNTHEIVKQLMKK